MNDKLKNDLNNLDSSLTAIKLQGLKYLDNNSLIDDSKNLKIFHRPWIAPQNWGISLFKAADNKWFHEFNKRTNKQIPDFYQNFLTQINGCFIYNLSLFGLPPSIYNSGLLSRSILQCHDLTTANINWINEYRVDRDSFYFGSRPYSPSENIGYFYIDSKIKCLRKAGELFREWDDFSTFLNDEIIVAENQMLEKLPVEIRTKINKN